MFTTSRLAVWMTERSRVYYVNVSWIIGNTIFKIRKLPWDTRKRKYSEKRRKLPGIPSQQHLKTETDALKRDFEIKLLPLKRYSVMSVGGKTTFTGQSALTLRELSFTLL